MQVQSPGKLPDSVTKPMAWNAFDHVFHETDWRLRIRSLAPLSFDVQHDGDFSACLSDCMTWQGKRRARSWIAGRILELASAYDRTLVRSLSLQIPEVSDGPVAEALLTYLERRLRNTILDELVAHFDTSIPEWERSIQIEIAQLDDSDARWHATRYAGLDQLVSTDAARKAIRFVMHRMHWYLDEQSGLTVLHPDWRFEHVRAQRSTLHEETRARSLVARCVEVMVEGHVREQKAGLDVAPMTRPRLKAELERRFADKGVWGLIDLSLPRDRSRHHLHIPERLGGHLSDLLTKQNARLNM